jgi:hypothetical protein
VLESTAKELRTVRPGGQNGRDGQGREWHVGKMLRWSRKRNEVAQWALGTKPCWIQNRMTDQTQSQTQHLPQLPVSRPGLHQSSITVAKVMSVRHLAFLSLYNWTMMTPNLEEESLKTTKSECLSDWPGRPTPERNQNIRNTRK